MKTTVWMTSVGKAIQIRALLFTRNQAPPRRNVEEGTRSHIDVAKYPSSEHLQMIHTILWEEGQEITSRDDHDGTFTKRLYVEGR